MMLGDKIKDGVYIRLLIFIMVLIASCGSGTFIYASKDTAVAGKVAQQNKTGKKVRLSSKKVSISIGRSKKITLKNAKAKVKWKIVKGKKNISIKKFGRHNRTIKIKGRRAGTARIRATYKKKKYYIKVTVKNYANKSTDNNTQPEAVIKPTTENESSHNQNNNPTKEEGENESEASRGDTSNGDETVTDQYQDRKYDIYVGFSKERGELIFSNKEDDISICDVKYGQVNCELDYESLDMDEYRDKTPQWVSEYAKDIELVTIKTKIYPYDISKWFYGCCNLTAINGIENISTEHARMAYATFYDCRSLTEINVTGFDTGNIMDMGKMFYRCSEIKQLDVSSFDTAKVMNFSRMFASCRNLESLIWSDTFVRNSETAEAFDMFILCPEELKIPDWCVR